MSSKRRIRRKSCDGKHQHETRSDAIAHKMSLIRNGLAERGEMWVYHCEFCKKWHTGHPPKGLVSKQQFYTENK